MADVYYSMPDRHATVCAATLARIVYCEWNEAGKLQRAEGSSRYQLAIEDGAFPECALGIVHSLNVTAFMSINTLASYAGSLLLPGNPVAYAVTPYVFGPKPLPMGVVQRVANCLTHVFADLLHWVSLAFDSGVRLLPGVYTLSGYIQPIASQRNPPVLLCFCSVSKWPSRVVCISPTNALILALI